MAFQNAEVRLGVSLDLTSLRQQLNTIGTQLAGQPVALAIKLDRKIIAKEYRLLDRYLSSKTYNVKIESNTLDTLVEKVRKFQERLKRLQEDEISLNVKVGAVPSFNARDAAKVRSTLKSSILGDEGKLYVGASIKPKISRAEIRDFTNAVKSKLANLSVTVRADLEMASIRGGAKSQADIDADVRRGLQAISEMGAARMGKASGAGVTEAARRESLRTSIEDLTVKQLQQIAKQLEVSGTSRLRKADLIAKIVSDASIEMVKKYLDPQAMMRPNQGPLQQVMDTFARGVLHMLGLDAASMRQQFSQKRLPPAIDWPAQRMPAGLLPSMTQRTATARGVEAIIRNTIGGPSGGGRDGELVDTKRIYAALQKNLDEILRRTFVVIEVDVQETSATLREALRSFSYLAQALKDAEARAKTARIDAAVDSLMRRIEETVKIAQARLRIVPAQVSNLGAPAQRMLQGQRMAGLLPAAIGRTPNIYSSEGESRASMFARREQEARMRSALRGVGLGQHFTERPRLPGTTFMGDEFTAGGGRDRVRGMGQPPGRGGALAFAGGPFTELPKNYFEQVKRFNAALDVARASMKNFQGENTPFIGGLRGIASEFGQATKQVLLYGTAYKGLAFITSLPEQIINAAKGQQQFANATQVATQETRTFGKEMLFVDNVQRTFGLNLDSTRTGFTRLFASMAPSGFDSGAIEKLFLGISAAAASLQMTPDKVDRVIYAFGQMASKGQIMSEELKGQLGDVLPGALALFAKAAGMSVKDFSKAMEDGQFVGGRFQEVFAKVSDELVNRFGTGAQVASRSIVGLTNKVQGEFTRTLEALAPLADAAIAGVLGPLPGVLRQLATAGQIATGEIGRVYGQIQQAQKDLTTLRESGGTETQIKGAEQSIRALTFRYEELNKAAQDPAIARQVTLIQDFAKQVEIAGRFVMNFAQNLGSVLSPVLALLGGNFTTVVSVVASLVLGFQAARLAAAALMGSFILFRTVTAALGLSSVAVQAGTVAAAFNVLGVSATEATVATVGLGRALFALTATTVVGLIVAGIVAIAGAFASARDRAQEASQASRNYAKAAMDAAASADIAGATMNKQNILAESRKNKDALDALERIYAASTKEERAGQPKMIDVRNAAALQQSKLTSGMLGDISGGRYTMRVPSRLELEDIRRQFGSVAGKQKVDMQTAKIAEEQARQRAKALGIAMPGATPSGADASAQDATLQKQQQAMERAQENARRLADDKRKYEADLMKMGAEQAMSLDDMAFEHWKKLQEEKYNILVAGENSWVSQALKFQKELQDVEISRIETVRNARQEAQKAEVEANARAMVAQESLPFRGGAVTNRRRDPDAEATGWDISMPGGRGAAVPAPIGLTITGTGFQGKGAGATGRGYGNWISGEFELGGKKYELLLGHFDRVDVSEGMQVPAGATLGTQGITGRTFGSHVTTHVNPKGGATKQDAWGALESVTQRWEKGMTGALPARQRKEATKDHNAQLAVVDALNKKEQENLAIQYKNIEARLKLAAIIKQQVAEIAPVQEQKLENDLIKQKISLISSGAFGEALNTEEKIAEATAKATLNIGIARSNIEDNTKLAKELKWTNEQLTAENQKQLDYIDQQQKALASYIPLLRERLALAQKTAEAELQGQIQRATPLGGLGLSAGYIGAAASKYEEAIGLNASPQEASRLAELQNQLTLLEERNNAVKSSILGIGDAFGTAMTTGVASLVDGTASAEEVFSNFLKSVGQTLLQAAQQMIATYIAIGIARIFAGMGKNSISGGGGDSVANLNAGAAQYGGGAGGMVTIADFGGIIPKANGGVLVGGFQAFASGGVVAGPTLGLVGEGKYNEAIVPLPDGKSIPVMMRGEQPSSRDLIGGGSMNGAMAPILNMTFESTTINGVEYVSRDQLEQAMMDTRKAAARDGASRGATLAIDRLQQSPSTRRRIGLS